MDVIKILVSELLSKFCGIKYVQNVKIIKTLIKNDNYGSLLAIRIHFSYSKTEKTFVNPLNQDKQRSLVYNILNGQSVIIITSNLMASEIL